MSNEAATSAKAFLIGGGIIAGAKYISKRVSALWASLLGGLPTGIISAMFLKDDKDIHKFYNGYLIQSVVLTIIIILLNVAIASTDISVNKLLIIAISIWLVVSILMIHLLKKESAKIKSDEPV